MRNASCVKAVMHGGGDGPPANVVEGVAAVEAPMPAGSEGDHDETNLE